MRRLVRGFAGRTYHIVGNLMHWLILLLFQGNRSGLNVMIVTSPTQRKQSSDFTRPTFMVLGSTLGSALQYAGSAIRSCHLKVPKMSMRQLYIWVGSGFNAIFARRDSHVLHFYMDIRGATIVRWSLNVTGVRWHFHFCSPWESIKGSVGNLKGNAQNTSALSVMLVSLQGEVRNCMKQAHTEAPCMSVTNVVNHIGIRQV